MPTARIKFCGMTQAEDIRAAVHWGVDAIGLVLTQKSGRFIDIDQAQSLRLLVPPFVTTVAVFLDDESAWVEHCITSLAPDLLQFHGNEDATYCAQFRRRYLKAVAMASITDIATYMAAYPQAAGFLFDSHSSGNVGGAGVTVDWARIPQECEQPLILAGGLTPENVGEAIKTVSPWAVDVSSGIELSPGVKDSGKMRCFIDEVRRVVY